jgi:hypothetical protein
VNRTPQSSVLIASCRATPLEAEALRLDAIDWPRLIDAALALGVAGQVHACLHRRPDRSVVPRVALARLESAYYRQAARNAALHAALADVLVALERDGVPAIALKGTALAGTVYGNLALRPMRDVDLLVREDDVDAAESVLLREGYSADESYRPRGWYLHRHHHLPPFLAREGPAVVEIHWQLAPADVPVRVPLPAVWGRARRTEIAGVGARVLASDDLLLHLALHLAGADGFVGKLAGVCDVAEVVRLHGAELPWVRLCDTAGRSGAAVHVYYTLWLARALLGAKVPDGVLDALEASAGRGPVVDRAIKRFASWAVARPADAGRILGSGILTECGRSLLHRRTWGGRLRAVARTLYESHA